MQRPATSLTLALWGAVLGCCVWGVNASHSATGTAEAQGWINSQQVRDTSRTSERSRSSSIVALAYWSEILQHQATSLEKIDFHLSAAAQFTGAHIKPHVASLQWSLPRSIPISAFASIRNRWSLGFH